MDLSVRIGYSAEHRLKFLDAQRGDKQAIYRASNHKFDKLMKKELEEGKNKIAEAIKNAQKFEQGVGRGGQ